MKNAIAKYGAISHGLQRHRMCHIVYENSFHSNKFNCRRIGRPMKNGRCHDWWKNIATKNSSAVRTTKDTVLKWKWSITWNTCKRQRTIAHCTFSIAASVMYVRISSAIWFCDLCVFIKFLVSILHLIASSSEKVARRLRCTKVFPRWFV